MSVGQFPVRASLRMVQLRSLKTSFQSSRGGILGCFQGRCYSESLSHLVLGSSMSQRAFSQPSAALSIRRFSSIRHCNFMHKTFPRLNANWGTGMNGKTNNGGTGSNGNKNGGNKGVEIH